MTPLNHLGVLLLILLIFILLETWEYAGDLSKGKKKPRFRTSALIGAAVVLFVIFELFYRIIKLIAL